LDAGAVELLPGFWESRQAINRDATLRHGGEQLERAGNLENFRRLTGASDRPHGHVGASDGDVKNFVDSDIYKWLEAAGWESIRGPLPQEVEALAAEAVDLVLAAQDEDGYLNSWYQTQDRASRFSNLQYGHELYCLGHLIQAGLAWARGRGDTRLLDAGRRFADLVVETFRDGAREEVCGHPEIEMALVELSRETGDPRYRELATAFIRRRGYGTLGPGRFGSAYYQDRIPYADSEAFEGHAVRALYLACGAMDVATETGDSALVRATRRQWDNLTSRRSYLTGGVGSRHHGESIGDDYELPADRAYCETCASIAVVMLGWRMLLLERDGGVADAMERALFNGVLAGVSLDGLAFHYVNPLHVRVAHERQAWFEIACCPPNLMRTMASLEQLVATVRDGDVEIHQFMASRVRVGDRVIRIETEYPADGRIQIAIENGAGEWGLRVRVPGWVEVDDLSVTVNGDATRAQLDTSGYVELRRAWISGDVVVVEFPLAIRVTEPDPRIDAVRGTMAVERGPLAFALESVDLPSELPLSDVVAADGLLDEGPDRYGVPEPSLGVSGRNRPGFEERVPLVPYFAWGNRGTSQMRVWIPTL
jgi:DUF1680 family protein